MFSLKKGDLKTDEEDKALQENVVTYTQYDDIVDFAEDHAFNTDQDTFINKEMKDLISVPEEWSNLFNAINHLRVMNKFHPDFLFENLEFIATFCKESCQNLRSNISKNGLMLTNEMFKNKEAMQSEKYKDSITKFLHVVLPAVFARTVYDKVFIAKEAKNAVAQCMTNFVSPDTLTIIMNEGCKNRINNKTLTEISYTSFMKDLVSSADFK